MNTTARKLHPAGPAPGVDAYLAAVRRATLADLAFVSAIFWGPACGVLILGLVAGGGVSATHIDPMAVGLVVIACAALVPLYRLRRRLWARARAARTRVERRS